MEALPGAPLSPQEKEKLRAQLAFLRSEHRRTFRRLQRAERAECVKNPDKESAVEPSEPFLQEEAEKSPEVRNVLAKVCWAPFVERRCSAAALAESLSQASPEVSKPVLASAFLQPSPAKAAPAILGPTTRGHSVPETSGSEWSTPDPDSARCHPAGPRTERRQNRLSRSGTRARQRATPVLGEGGVAAWDALREDARCWQEGRTASAGNSGSPTFKRRSSALEPDQNIPTTPPSPAEGGSCGVVLLEPQPELLGQSARHGASIPPSDTASCERRLPSRHSLGGALANADAPAVEKPVERDAGQVWLGEGGPGSAAGLVGASEAFRGSGGPPLAPGCGGLDERSQREESQSFSLDTRETSLRKPGEMGLRSQGDAQPPLLAPPESPLSSCTVVEGLPFPVEYYVRTTRQMSRCQRRLDLAAVLRGQLGKGRRGQRGLRRGRGPSLEPAGNDGQPRAAPSPPPGACVGPGCEAVSLPQPRPLSRVPGQGLPQPRRGRRPRGRAGRRAAPAVLPERPPSPDHSSLVPHETQGQGTALSVGASGGLEVPPAEPALEPEGTWSSCTPTLGAGSAISCTRGLEVGSGAHRPERTAWEQERPRSSAGAEQVPLDALPLLRPEPLAAARRSDEGGAAIPSGGEGSALAVGSLSHPEPLNSKSGTASWKDLLFCQHPQELCVPGAEQGLPEPDACAMEQLEALDSAQSAGSLQGTGSACPEEASAAGAPRSCVFLEGRPPETSPLQPQQLQKRFPSHGLLLSPAPESTGSQLESQLPTLVFPLVGATPASQPLAGESPLQVKGSRPRPPGGARQRPAEAVGMRLEESQVPASQSVELCKASPRQVEPAAEDVVETLKGSQRGRTLQMTSKLQATSSACSVDVSAVWWGATGPAEVCIAVACEASVSLWRQLGVDRWEVLHTWHFAELPVSQIVPLPDVHNLLCVALGGWEMAQIRFLFQPFQDGGPEQSQVKAGNIKAVLGLKNRRLVVGCGSLPKQTVEVVSFSEAGKSEKRWSLMPPQENLLTFVEVDRMPDALVGLTAANCVVVWNLRTGQLLRRIPLGQPDPASVCHKAFSDAGLLFVVLSHPHARESKAGGTAAFQVVVLNPKTARGTGVAVLSIPQDIAGRCVEGRVRGTSAAAVLTSGTIAVWDLLLGQCTALLPPRNEGSWSLTRWSVTDDCLLARGTDGSIHIYSYTARLPCP